MQLDALAPSISMGLHYFDLRALPPCLNKIDAVYDYVGSWSILVGEEE